MEFSLLPFFQPRGVLVIGASTSPEKLGYGVARNLVQSGYPGQVHFVSQKPGELFGHLLHTDLGRMPASLDLAILIVPPAGILQALEDCGRHGIRAVTILSSGFREVGPEGAALEEQCLQVARAYSMRLLGPNCIGTINTHLPLDTSFLQPPMPRQGSIGFISHSGAFCAAIIDWSRAEGFGFSQLVSLGNQVDVNETDALAALAGDAPTRVIVLYMESVSNGRRFVEVARQVTRQKPVVALKAGRSESGKKAAASHTGALAASDIAFEAAFVSAGVLRAESAEQMFDWARALECYPHGMDPRAMRGSRNPERGIAILTNAGGPGVMAADALERNGLKLAQLTGPSLETLSRRLPAAANVQNPVDMLASASPETYEACLQTLLEDDHVDGVLIILPPPPMFRAEEVAEKILKYSGSGGLPGMAGTGSPAQKPVVVALMGSSLVDEARAVFERARIPTYPFPERAASALQALARRAETLAAETQDRGPLQFSRPPHDSLKGLPPHELVAAYGIPFAAAWMASSVDEAVRTADQVGYPLVMKIASPDIVHKSDVGGVRVGLGDVESLRSAYTQMIDGVRRATPEARIEGVLLQRQVPAGQEVIVGAVRDPQFGPLIMFGSGGVDVEGLRDVAFALAPLDRAAAWKLIRRTWAGKKLQGFRHLPPADEKAVVDVLLRLSQLVVEDESIQEIEINPLVVLRQGAIAVDARVR